MLIAKGDIDGKELLLLGITKKNVKALMKDRPILRDLRFAGVPFHVCIVYGEDEIELELKLRKAGMVGPDTARNGHPNLED